MMRDAKADLTKLAKLQEEYDDADRSVINETGGRNRQALIRLGDAAAQMVRIHEEAAVELRRVAGRAYDLGYGK